MCCPIENESGEPTELRYALSGYGIPEQLLPLSNTGTVKTANHSRLINGLRFKADREQHRKLTSSNNNHENRSGQLLGGGDNPDTTIGEDEIVDCPGSRDVIFRKGPTYKNNPGNMSFRELIEQTHAQHTKGSRKEKCSITWSIVLEIEARNGRFLDWCKTREMWIVTKDREKIRKQVAACYKQYNRTALTFRQQTQRKRTIADETPRDNRAAAKTERKTKPEGIMGLNRSEYSSRVIARNSNGNSNGNGNDNGNNVDQSLRKYYDTTHMFPSKSKRRKTFSLFCDCENSSTSSDSSV